MRNRKENIWFILFGLLTLSMALAIGIGFSS